MKGEKIEIVYNRDGAMLGIKADMSEEEELKVVICCAAAVVRNLTEGVPLEGRKKTMEALRGLLLKVMQDNLAVQGEKEEA